MKYIKLLFLSLIVLLQSCNGQEKINGVSFVASGIPVTDVHTNPVVNVHANYAAIMPFGFTKSLENPEIIHNSNRQWFGETRAGVKQYGKSLQAKGIKIMVKPQIWIRNGEFTGYLKMKTEADWKTLETSYSSFILEYAEAAQEINAEILCIGTELEQFVANRPEYWSNLITEIKKIYKGKLTYAANWDEYKRTPFWKQLDYIGIDAYFPVSDSKTPTVEECLKGWKTHKTTIKSFYDTYQKPILFTEYGYRSVDYAGKQPWVSDRSMNTVNLEAQNNTTKALFETFWKEDWFAGGFIWKWFHAHDEVGGENDSQFTPQNKPVEAIIKNHFKSHK
ncbi:glycoside hydrolase [Lacinutrix sp. MedPE-SW]|mgnify:CR=1 FL=1|uniref:glycoside hydrolase family 113 n=1 Tax=Lacinutrix sp. MedPE-SW TaxID=1860087 RepID=UPI000910C5AA|nr:glycoside hydrolase [Lacinutrix sp. MedPE-SW]OIQ23171.1 MAG: glycoside hydrolase [Lacinutrix sp. MedPE-SW]